ncbi:MAG: hypothetical protein JST19_17005 [Bacteroidetes bacterium]|nr:hypothetical protein [Bacteroidota bacterium]
MIKYTRLFITFLLAIIITKTQAQSTATTSSPYSKFGIGDIDNQLMPQNIGMGGIATATNNIGGYNSINVINPASYGKIFFTTIDAGVSTNVLTLSKNGFADSRNANTRLSHIVMAFPVTKNSALSFGILPYSEIGYNYKTSQKGFGTSPTPSGSANVDTNVTNYIYSGEGGLTKAYLGYGFGIGRHLTVGANVSFIFGNLKQFQSTELPGLAGAIDSRIEEDNKVNGVNFDYGAQYTVDLSATKHLVLGYSASVGNRLNEQSGYIVSQYYYDQSGNQQVAADSIINTQNPNAKLQLPRINHFGISFQKDNSFLVGADFSMGNWSDLSIAGVNAGLQNNKIFNIGGQITPNANALSNYFALWDYRLGFIYEQTYLNVNNVNLNRYAVTFGLGIPLPHDRASSAFYKINFSAEIGRRGTLTSDLIQEKYVNFHLAFLLNDRWFQRFKFE